MLFLGGNETQNPSFDETDEDTTWNTDGVTLKQLLADYETQCTRSNEIVAAACT
ncbi:hypothetical protein [Streptomyces huasconensis]|uniref:hypothetical protein n=1 Tax=Streptomyces huasconensis TaxID=1854574 RepID=UPI0036FE327F